MDPNTAASMLRALDARTTTSVHVTLAATA
jgi:hypothetical protein